MIQNTLLAITSAAILIATTTFSSGDTFSVPGTSNPWLAGMPAGTTLEGDSAPSHSPVLVLGFNPGDSLLFSATGLTGFVSGSESGPDGASNVSHSSAFGISAILNTPANALIGVFLGAAQPDASAAPSALSFSLTSSRDYLSLAPQLKQMFFIGDGQTSGAVQQAVQVPTGATRLFLGTMDGSGWFNNTGTLTVTTTVVPEPSGAALLAGAAILLGLIRRTRSNRNA